MKVFISYSHDSEEHRERVLGLSQRLRVEGIETVLDQYLNGAPPEGWPRWMLNQLDAADFVLVVCTETYYQRFRGQRAPDKGRGVDWEGALITQEIYEAKSATLKFVPVLFSADATKFVPEPLRALNYYVASSKVGYLGSTTFSSGRRASSQRRWVRLRGGPDAPARHSPSTNLLRPPPVNTTSLALPNTHLLI